MVRLEAAVAWCFSCLGVVLLGVSILVVPSHAFADSGSECAETCKNYKGTSGYGTCVGGCCSSKCSGDPVCGEECCLVACGSDSTCFDTCLAAQPKNCNVVSCEGGCGVQKTPSCGDRKFDDTWCLKTKNKAQCNGCVCGVFPMYSGQCTCGLK
jgi:hypothetical protein